MIGEYPDGVPHWLRGEPPGRVREMMRLRTEGYTLLGLEPGDDAADLFRDGDEEEEDLRA